MAKEGTCQEASRNTQPGGRPKRRRTYPEGDAHTALDIQARTAHSGVGIGQDLLLLRGGRRVHADVELGVGDVNAEAGRLLEGLGEILLGRDGD